jgi:hypothetical protein
MGPMAGLEASKKTKASRPYSTDGTIQAHSFVGFDPIYPQQTKS